MVGLVLGWWNCDLGFVVFDLISSFNSIILAPLFILFQNPWWPFLIFYLKSLLLFWILLITPHPGDGRQKCLGILLLLEYQVSIWIFIIYLTIFLDQFFILTPCWIIIFSWVYSYSSLCMPLTYAAIVEWTFCSCIQFVWVRLITSCQLVYL